MASSREGEGNKEVIKIALGTGIFHGKWYVARRESSLHDAEYLHQDGQWRTSTQDGDQWTGYFDTKELDEAALKEWREKNPEVGRG